MKLYQHFGWSILVLPAICLLYLGFGGKKYQLRSDTHTLIKRDISSTPYTSPPVPLGTWTDWMRQLRILFRGGQAPPIAALLGLTSGGSSGTSAFTPLIKNYLPAMIALAVIFLGAVLLLFFSVAMCCSSCFGGKRRQSLKYSKMKPASSNKRHCARALFVIPYLVVLLAIAFHILGSYNFTSSMGLVQNSTTRALSDTLTLFANVPIAFGSALDNIGTAVNVSVDAAVASINFNVFHATVDVNMGNMITRMRATQNDKETVLSGSAVIMSNRLTLTTNAILLISRNPFDP